MDPLASVETRLAPDPKACPICDATGPFEHVRDAFLCTVCLHVFAVDEQGQLVRWWATQKSRPIWW